MKNSIAIEDNFEDVLSKAMSGLGFSIEEAAGRSGIPAADLQLLLSGKYDEATARHLAISLSLSADCLHQLATDAQRPVVDLPVGICLHNTAFPIPAYEEMTVNSYTVVPPGRSNLGCLIDAGSSYESVFHKNNKGTALNWSLFLTHTHADHVENFSQLSRVVLTTYAPTREPYPGARSVKEGDIFKLGHCQLKALETTGHSPGGMSYLLEGLEKPVVFVGDALFCCSIGRVRGDYESALTQIQEKILSLPEETILCPGHGPLTTVAFERRYNPFFAKRFIKPFGSTASNR